MERCNTESIGRYISHFFRVGVSYLGKEYKKLNIGAGQYQFLLQLYFKNGLSHDELTEKMSVDKATTTRAIAKLEQEGYVRKILNAQDKRKYNIFLTDYAIDRKEEIINIAKKWEERLTGSLSKEEQDQLLELFRKITRNNFDIRFDDEELICDVEKFK
ncbi:MarR family transcriptional regulator [Clostridiaceae bacterium 14S0207]|nr:MarR family transcriptional regulator [Clostridiaceae bacterium 14S0207]